MEKFTVDLDKVLDEFEFNEEQAFHQENFKNEDLPAKKYKKPHFQPINMADADFSPSVETTMPFLTHNRKHSQDSTNSSTTSDNVSFNYKCSEINHAVISDLLEPPNVNNFEAIKGSENVSDNAMPVVNKCNSENESSSIRKENDFDEDDAEVRCELSQDCVNVAEVDTNSINVDVIPENCVVHEKCVDFIAEKCVDVIPEKFESSNEESHTKPDLIGSKCDNEDEDKDEILKLPDLTDVNKDSFQETANNKIENLDLISNEKESCEIIKREITAGENSDNKSDPPSPDITEQEVEPPEETSDIKPIQFQSDNEITDEDLHRYLEELEEEEEEEQEVVMKRIAEAESKPVRPDFLNLNERNQPEGNGSPGLTPLPNKQDVVSSDTSREDDQKNEAKAIADEVPVAESSYHSNKNNERPEEAESVPGVPNVGRQAEPLTVSERRLGKVSPFWMPDHFASNCMDCDVKFNVIKRRHHCRACGRILCSKCCGMRASLEYLQNQEQRVCNSCFLTLAKVMMYELQYEGESDSSPTRRPNPNSPMEYCSTVPPPLQVSSSTSLSPPSVLVPVGVLKREGTAKVKENTKQVMFSDGIRPGGDLTDLDGSADQRRAFKKAGRASKRVGTPPGNSLSSARMLPPIDPNNQSFIPEKGIPPVCVVNKGETTYQENWPYDKLMQRLKDESLPPLTFAVNRHLIVSLKIVKLVCCMDKTCWAFSTRGMECVGQDEILILLTLKDDSDDIIPRDIFLQLHCIYQEAAKGNTITELDSWCVLESNFLDSPQHGGFIFIRPTSQCLNLVDPPPPPFLVGVLIHRSEIPWARVFPIRLMLRLGAEYRYYPCPLLSVRFRDPVYHDIGHTIIKLLADFRSLSYTLANVRGLKIHVEGKQVSILIPRNRYDQIIRALNNSNEPVLALAGNFSPEADSHYVCIQADGDEITYTTQTANINGTPRKVTGASFVVLNGALKSTSGLSAKKSIIEDGLLVQVPNETMTVLRNKLRNMEDWSVKCGPIEGDGGDGIVRIVWCEDDRNFNVGVRSVIDNMALDGIPSIRTHNFADCMGSTKFIRWTQVFIIKCEDGATSAKIGDPLEVKKLSENIAKATCIALKKLLDLLAASGITVLAVRATIEQDNVGYEAGSNGEKLPPIYMNSLDNELIPVLHKAASANDSVAVLELVFHVMDQ